MEKLYLFLKESLSLALFNLNSNRFRTLLSLLGVAAGIFSILSILVAVDALKRDVKKGLGALAPNILHISTWPIEGEDENGCQSPDEEYRWWDYIGRPTITVAEAEYLQRRLLGRAEIAWNRVMGSRLSIDRQEFPNVETNAVSSRWREVSPVAMAKGRWFTEMELERGAPVAVIGAGFNCSEGGKVRINGVELSVVGVCATVGKSVVGFFDTDNGVFVPHRLHTINSSDNITLFAKPADGTDPELLQAQVMIAMRSARRVAPGERNNFSINRISLLAESAEELFSLMRSVGWIIAAFSLLVGGFGIANIMYCSVKERTHIIGIQMALGADKRHIMIQFLLESFILSLFGGVAGIIAVVVAISLVPKGSFEPVLSIGAITAGIVTSVAVGLLSGYFPARSAASLRPADAISSQSVL